MLNALVQRQYMEKGSSLNFVTGRISKSKLIISSTLFCNMNELLVAVGVGTDVG